MNPIIDQHFIYWPQLIQGHLIKRYKRFLADVKLNTGELVTAHCPNSGSMKECSEAGRPVFLSFHDNPKRKLKYTWELIDMHDSLVGVNTQIPNRLVELAISSGRIKELNTYTRINREVKVSDHSRLDLFLSNEKGETCFVEVKNCTLVKNGKASFPDAITTRGRKHLVELQKLVKSGVRSVIFFLVQRMDAEIFKPADDIDKEYGVELRKAYDNGVEMLVYDVSISQQKIGVNNKLPFLL
ncbi:DNA/RNA nuclease SfsA [bacterium]|nr:DNA/RNA nuclease SfsA [bacterium]